jgi:hypothetical protein
MKYGVILVLQNAVNKNFEKQIKYIWHLVVNIFGIATLSVLQLVVFI